MNWTVPSLTEVPGEGEIRSLGRALVVLYFAEVGVVLIIAPWTRFWDQNYFVEAWPMTEAALTSPAVRGAVTGIGFVSLWAAVMETSALFRGRWGQSAETAPELYGGTYPPSS